MQIHTVSDYRQPASFGCLEGQHTEIRCVFTCVCFKCVSLRYVAMSHPVSVHLYFLADQFQGYLVRHLATNRASTQLESLETWVAPKDHFTLAKPPHPTNRLQHVQVRPIHIHIDVFILSNLLSKGPQSSTVEPE